jgi:hypothetical protein
MATDVFTSYLSAQDGIEGIEIELPGRPPLRVYFDDLIDLQIDLFHAGLNAEAIRSVLRDVERARDNTLPNDAYWEEAAYSDSTPYQYQWSAAPYWGPREPAGNCRLGFCRGYAFGFCLSLSLVAVGVAVRLAWDAWRGVN